MRMPKQRLCHLPMLCFAVPAYYIYLNENGLFTLHVFRLVANNNTPLHFLLPKQENMNIYSITTRSAICTQTLFQSRIITASTDSEKASVKYSNNFYNYYHEVDSLRPHTHSANSSSNPNHRNLENDRV
jgi:hypothetical protein